MVTMILWLCCDTGDKSICMFWPCPCNASRVVSLLTFLYADQPLVSLLMLFCRTNIRLFALPGVLCFFFLALLLSCDDSHIQGTHCCIVFLKNKGRERKVKEKQKRREK